MCNFAQLTISGPITIDYPEAEGVWVYEDFGTQDFGFFQNPFQNPNRSDTGSGRDFKTNFGFKTPGEIVGMIFYHPFTIETTQDQIGEKRHRWGSKLFTQFFCGDAQLLKSRAQKDI